MSVLDGRDTEVSRTFWSAISEFCYVIVRFRGKWKENQRKSRGRRSGKEVEKEKEVEEEVEDNRKRKVKKL